MLFLLVFVYMGQTAGPDLKFLTAMVSFVCFFYALRWRHGNKDRYRPPPELAGSPMNYFGGPRSLILIQRLGGYSFTMFHHL